MDEQYLKTPFYGSRRITVHLRQQGFSVNRQRVQRLMHQLGLQAIYPKPKLSQPHPEQNSKNKFGTSLGRFSRSMSLNEA